VPLCTIDVDTAASVVITEDVVAQGGRFVDCFSARGPDEVARGLEQLAELHACTWMDADLAATGWLISRFEMYLKGRGAEAVAENFGGSVGARIPTAVKDANALVAAYRRVADTSAQVSPWSIIHGDPHIANVYRDAIGRPCFVDWQLVQRGSPFVDFGYHLASALPVNLRRTHEAELVDHYLGALLARGVDIPATAVVWHGIRCGFVHGLYLWAITTQVTPEIVTELLARLGGAVADHGALDRV
jgi:Ecdysteroid kinase-like family